MFASEVRVVPSLAVALLALWACLGSSPDEVEPAAPVDVVEPVPDDPVPVAVPDPTSATMLAIASGQLTAADVLDEVRGFVLVEVFDDASGSDPRADPRGQVRAAERVCGARAKQRFSELKDDLAARTEGGTKDVFTCDGPVCTHPPIMELDKTGSYAFQAPEGHQVLAVVVRIGGIPSSPADQQQIEAWVDEQLRELGGEDCP